MNYILKMEKPELKAIKAKHIGGVKTEKGKQIAKLNATKHGILSKESVITSGEAKEDIQEFLDLREQFMQSLQPVGVLEEMLTDKLFSCYWRLRRVVRSENGEIARRVDNLKVKEKIETNGAQFVRLWETPSDEHLNTRLGLEATMYQLQVSKEDVESLDCITPETFRRLSNCYNFRPYSFLFMAQFYNKAFKDCQNKQGFFALDQVKESYYQSADREIKDLKKRLRLLRKKEKLDNQAAIKACVLPDKEVVEKLQRYENGLEKSFYRALNVLQRTQAIRLGVQIPSESPININLNQINQNN